MGKAAWFSRMDDSKVSSRLAFLELALAGRIEDMQPTTASTGLMRHLREFST
jgi:hypothetical protein